MTTAVSRILRCMVAGTVAAGVQSIPAQALKDVGTAITSCAAPIGTGAKDLSVIHDGVYPDATTGSWGLSYDTYDAAGAPVEAYFGYTFTEPYTFTRLIFHQGMTEVEGGATLGTFAVAPRVQVQNDTGWADAQGLVNSPPYAITFAAFTSDTFTFTATTGTGIRIIGMEQDPEAWVSCSELDVEGAVSGIREAAHEAPLPGSIRCRNLGRSIAVTVQTPDAGRGMLVISDMSGRAVRRMACERGVTVEIDGGLAPGWYLARFESSTGAVLGSAFLR